MKTKTVRVEELEGEALVWAMRNLFPYCNDISGPMARWIIRNDYGPTVEVPAELVEVSDE